MQKTFSAIFILVTFLRFFTVFIFQSFFLRFLIFEHFYYKKHISNNVTEKKYLMTFWS